MKKFMMYAAFVVAMSAFAVTVNAQEAKPKKVTKTEQCQKKCDKKCDKAKEKCKDSKGKACCKKSGKEAGHSKNKPEKK